MINFYIIFNLYVFKCKEKLVKKGKKNIYYNVTKMYEKCIDICILNNTLCKFLFISYKNNYY